MRRFIYQGERQEEEENRNRQGADIVYDKRKWKRDSQVYMECSKRQNRPKK
jgi:hypothetical protein